MSEGDSKPVSVLSHMLENGDMGVYHTGNGALAIIDKPNVKTVKAWLEDPSRVAAEGGNPLAKQWTASGFASTERNPRFARRNDTSNVFLVVLPTEDCNFRCVYCYESHRKGPMRRQVQDGLLRWLEGWLPGKRSLTLEWFGGEPLAAWRVIEYLSPRIKKVAEAAGVAFRMSMTTNASLLTRDRIELLQEWGCEGFHIALDGPQFWHDARRRTRGGRPTFARVWRSLELLRESNFPLGVMVRLHFDRRSVTAVDELIVHLGQVFAGDARFQFYPKSLFPGSDGCAVEAFEGEEAAVAARKLMGSIIRAGLRPYRLVENYGVGGMVCYAGWEGSLVIGADGAVYKCTVDFELPENHVGRLFEDGRLEIDQHRWSLWTQGGRNLAECEGCPLLIACEACGCPLPLVREGVYPCPQERKSRILLQDFELMNSLRRSCVWRANAADQSQTKGGERQ